MMTSPPSAAPTLTVEDMSKIIKDIFTSMVDMEIHDGRARNVSGKAGPRVTAVVGISGPRRFAVVLETSEALACRIASRMTGGEFSSWASPVEDAFAEVANMTAGNLKTSLKCPGLSISLPTVIHGFEFYWSAPRMRILQEAYFYCQDEELRVCVGDEPESSTQPQFSGNRRRLEVPEGETPQPFVGNRRKSA